MEIHYFDNFVNKPAEKKTSEKSHQCKIQIICNNWYYAYLSTSTKSGQDGTQNLLESPWTNIIDFEISQWSLCCPVSQILQPHGKHILTTNCGALQIDFLMIPLHLQFFLPITCGIVFIKIPGVFLQSLGMFWSYSLWCGLQFKNKGSTYFSL